MRARRHFQEACDDRVDRNRSLNQLARAFGGWGFEGDDPRPSVGESGDRRLTGCDRSGSRRAQAGEDDREAKKDAAYHRGLTNGHPFQFFRVATKRAVARRPSPAAPTPD